MACPECGSEEGSVARLCPDCIERRQNARRQKIEAASSRPRLVRIGRPRLSPLLQRGLFVLALAFILFAVLQPREPASLPVIQLRAASTSSADGDPCEARKLCLVVYLAPWCPACEASIGLLQGLRNQTQTIYKNTGIKIIVGGDEEARLQDMASRLGGQVLLDVDGKFSGLVPVGAIPSWWLIDGQRKVLDRGHGLSSDMENIFE